eukprot:362884-Chlamydomonas_euryale.AAC.1
MKGRRCCIQSRSDRPVHLRVHVCVHGKGSASSAHWSCCCKQPRMRDPDEGARALRPVLT